MHRWNGRYYPGAMKARREEKRIEAEERNALTPTRRTRAFREGVAPRAKSRTRKP